MRVIIVEELLLDRDLEVTAVYSAQEAVALDAGSYDGAVIDVMLPNDPAQSGITTEESRGGFCAGVCVARRLLKQNASIRVILLTSDIVDSEAET
jgi:DNA-binding NarL/FixJ family response regulator